MANSIGGRRVVFPAHGKAELQDYSFDADLGPDEVLIRSHYSVISPGTELSIYTGLDDAMPVMRERANLPRPHLDFPRMTGYGNVGEVLDAGSAVKSIKPGDRVISMAPHASVAKTSATRFCYPLRSDVAEDRAVFARMAAVAATALRASSVSAGDTALVLGLGLVGNFAAQLLQLAGADVLAVDSVAFRCQVASGCGIGRTANPSSSEDLTARVLEWTGGRGADIVVEAIGISELAALAVQLARRGGDVLLLGSPRAAATFDVTPMLTRIHLMGITVKGSLEWLFPLSETTGVKHSIARNYGHILDWMSAGRLKVDELRTHTLAPERCAEAYDGLLNKKDEYLGVVFKWRISPDGAVGRP